MKSMIRNINNHGIRYQGLMFVCPGCAVENDDTGLHLLSVNTNIHSPAWDWDGNTECPTLSPSIITGRGTLIVCHAFLKKGVFQFLPDSTHILSGTFVEMPDLPDWVANAFRSNY